MKQNLRHIILIVLTIFMGIVTSFGQNVRYVQYNSTHALSVPANDDYTFKWAMTWGATNIPITIQSDSNVTEDITWSQRNTHYDISVTPILDSVGCVGEPIYMTVFTVDHASLVAGDDVFYTRVNVPVNCDVTTNDFDYNGLDFYYTAEPVTDPKHGTVSMQSMGLYTYTPDPGFIGIDSFVYEVWNEDNYYVNALVTIIVSDNDKTANLHIDKTGPAKALFGSEITYIIIVKNNGPDIAENVVVKDSLPFGLFNPRFSTGGPLQPWDGSIGLGNLASGDSVIITLKADISIHSPMSVYNQASTYSNSFDTDVSDNASVWFTEISALFVDLPDQILVPGCRAVTLPNLSGGNNKIVKYLWRPGIGLSDSTIATPVFTPDSSTVGQTLPYILFVTDIYGNIASDTIKLIVSEIPVATIEGAGIDTLYRDLHENLAISGSQSTGDRLTWFWWTNDGNIISLQNKDSITIDTLGFYHLDVEDRQKCTASDSVRVLLRSRPPVAVNDYVAIVAGTDSTVNVLTNDYDINGFDLRVTRILTEPNHGTYTVDQLGNVTFTPNISYWLLDSLEYQVCNNGQPEMCSSAWLIVHCLRPPLNADIVVEKTADSIAFWGDTIRYNISIFNEGPDTATFVSLYDKLNIGFINPVFSASTDHRVTWSPWKPWKGQYDFLDSLIPQHAYFLQIKAFIDPRADRFIYNTAYKYSNIIENDFTDDTSTVRTKIKQMVIARAGVDRIIGACQDTIMLNGKASQGENITYRWSPAYYLDNPTSPTPTFRPGTTTTYILTITDDDGITDTDTVTVRVLPPPVANAGPDRFLLKDPVVLDGSRSTGTGLNYVWTTSNGHTMPGTQYQAQAGADSIGTYFLKVTDIAKCFDRDTMMVYRFYYPPFVIPDFYSTEFNMPIVSDDSIYRSVLYNDFDPNEGKNFTLMAEPVTNQLTKQGGRVTINSDGTFVYTPRLNFTGIDVFTYEVCNSAQPPHSHCSRGYVQITVNNKIQVANLSIHKVTTKQVSVIGYPGDVEFMITVKNHGPDPATGVIITDTVSQYISGMRYKLGGGDQTYEWLGATPIRSIPLEVGDSITLMLTGTLASNAPARVFNAASVASSVYDDKFDWDDVENRNVDTASVSVNNGLLAKAELIEDINNKNRNDGVIGFCDVISYLSGQGSKSLTPGDDVYQWSPRDFLSTPDSSVNTTFNQTASDTTIVFTLSIISGNEQISTSSVTVRISPEVKAIAGPDKKKNEGVPLTLSAFGQGENATFTWYKGSQEIPGIKTGDSIRTTVNDIGVYTFYVVDMHGCSDMDTVIVRENSLFALNDILVVISNKTFTGNVATNDYDPNGDSIYYPGVVYSGPLHGNLRTNPPGYGGINGSNGLKISNNGTYIYRSANNYTGDDYFTYEVCDNNKPDLCLSGKVFIKVINVDSINSPPVANHDVFFVNKNSSVRSNLLANDYDFDGGTISIDTNPIRLPKKGVVVLNSNGTFEYRPAPDEVGADSFYYRIRDNGIPVAYDTTMVYIYINKIEEENHKPVAVDDAYYAVEKTITGNVLLNDYDPDGNDFFLDQFVTVLPTHGTFYFIDQYGNFEYTPDPGFEGTDQMIYQIKEAPNSTIESYATSATVYFTSLSEKRFRTDLEVVKTGTPFVLSGDTVQYTIKTTNNGPTMANDVVISDTLFSELKKGQYSRDGGDTWKPWINDTLRIDRLPLYGEYEFLIRAILPDSIWIGLPDTFVVDLLNTAKVSHDMVESKPENNDSTWVTRVYQKVYAEAGNDTLIGACITEYQLDASGSIGMGTLQYKWSPADDLNRSNVSNPIFSTTPGEVQKFTLIVSSNYGGLFPMGKDTDEVWVEVGNSPVSDAGPDFWDITDSVTLDGSGSRGELPLSYSWWQYDSENQVKVIDTTMITKIYKGGDFHLTVTDRFGCTDDDLMHIGFLIEPFVAVDDTVETAQQEATVCIKVLANDIIDPDDSYDLTYLMVTVQPKHGRIIESPFDSCFIYVPEDYFIGADTFTYTVSTEHNYSDEAIVIVHVVKKPPIVPEGFSPNGDGINDVLIIENIEKYGLNSIIIFNRWGNVVYKKTKYSNSEPWDGVANKGVRIGQGRVPAGIYLYILDLGDDKINLYGNRIVKGNIYVATDNRR
jgi:gliding motility-associated-like protein/uncharacterized repeat protein (TIGR01451 family)